MKKILLLHLILVALLTSGTAFGQQINLDIGLVAHYPFHNGSLADLSPLNITASGQSVVPVADRFGQADSALLFNGSSSMLYCGTHDRLLNTKATLCAWIKTSDPSLECIASKYAPNSPTQQGRGIIIRKGGGEDDTTPGVIGHGLAICSGRDGNSLYKSSGFAPKPINDGEWHFILGIVDGQTWKVYVDGSLANTRTFNDPGSTLNTAFNFTIGRGVGNNSTTYFNGIIDDVRLYNRALTSAEVLALYNIQANGWLSSTADMEDASNTINVFPNPSVGQLNIESESDIERVQLIDLTGRILEEFEGNRQTQLQLNTAFKGYAILRIFTTEGQFNKPAIFR